MFTPPSTSSPGLLVPTIYTVGHSTRSLEAFLTLLTSHGIRAVADVRRYPRSRKFPHFNDDALAVSLSGAGLEYLPFLALGGRRRPAKDSPNTGWRSEAFRGYADYMTTEAFKSALAGLIVAAGRSPTAIMCAEAVPWRCHRSLIADALLARGVPVIDVMSALAATPHKMTPFAKVSGSNIIYPAEQGDLFSPDGSSGTSNG